MKRDPDTRLSSLDAHVSVNRQFSVDELDEGFPCVS
jgi:hypothetical protein